MVSFSERLKELREEKGLSLDKLAKALGLSDTTVCNWENGKHDIKSADLIKVAKFFSVPVEYLLGLSD